MKKVLLGQITSAHGIKGLVRVYPYTDEPERYLEIEEVFLDNEEKIRKVETVAIQKNMVLLKIEGIGDRNEAERVKGKKIYIPFSARKQVEEDQFFISDLIGLSALDHETKEEYGVVKDLISQTGNDVLLLEGKDGDFMIPFVKSYVKRVSLEEKSIYVELIEGILP